MAKPEPKILRRGKEFHRAVQADWRRGLPGVVFEKSVRKPNGRRGRIDVFVDAESGLIAIAEVKNSGWDRMTERAVRINVSRQTRQIWDYIESRLAEGNDVSPGVVFSRRPRMARRLALIEGLFAERGISAVWQDESIAKRRARPGLK